MSQYSVTAKDPKNEIIVAWNQSADSYIATVLSTEGSGEKSIVLSLKALKP